MNGTGADPNRLNGNRRSGWTLGQSVVGLSCLAALCTYDGARARAVGATVQVRLTQQEALRLAFPDPAEIERRTAFLGEEQVEEAKRLAGEGIRLEQRVVSYYVGTDSTGVIGAAYFDVHRVRTLTEVLMIVVDRRSRISRIELLTFSEPPEYSPADEWLEQFYGSDLSEGLSLKGSIVGMTGATLTSRAVTYAARRVLALHEVIRPFRIEEAAG